jgi:N-acetylglucosaminyl-diphospho-decaprenol L-rhamnosyltransferase
VANGPAPDLSVIVVNYRSAKLTLRAVEAVCESVAMADLSVQEIIVDGASGGDDVAVLSAQRPQAQVIALEKNRGFAAGNNAGIAAARGRWLLLVNPDAFAQGHAVARLLAHGDAHPEAGVVAPLLLNEDLTPQDNAFRRFPDMHTLFVDFCAPVAFLIRGTRLDVHAVPRSWLQVPQSIAHATGAALLVRAEAAAAAGPLDEGFFMYLEETEWQRRITRVGWEVQVVPDARFVHLGGGSSATSPLASPAYLDSIARYHRRPWLALSVARVAGLISLVSLRVAIRLGLGSAQLVGLRDSFAQLHVELRSRGLSGLRLRPARH